MARGIGLVALAGTLRHPVYNIGSGRCPRYGEFATALSMTLPPGGTPGAMDGRWVSIDRARDELGYAPAFSVDQVMAKYVEHVRAAGL